MPGTDAFAALYGRFASVTLRPAPAQPPEPAREVAAGPRERPSRLLPRLLPLRPGPRRPTWHLD